MGETIIVAIIALIGTLGGSYLSNRKSSALIAYRIEQLEAKQDKHNDVIDRVYKLEERADLYDEKMKVANHRIDDLEAAQRETN